jgi:hypothetical protein
MPDAVTSTTLQDTGRVAVMRFTNLSDATGESAVSKVTASNLAADPVTGKACTAVSIKRIIHSTQGMAVNIFWDATADVLAWTIPADTSDDLDFDEIGPLTNNAGAGKTNVIQFTTVGAGAGDAYVVVMVLGKIYG